MLDDTVTRLPVFKSEAIDLANSCLLREANTGHTRRRSSPRQQVELTCRREGDPETVGASVNSIDLPRKVYSEVSRVAKT